MKRAILIVAFFAAGAALADAAQKWEWQLYPAEVKYAIYGGDLGDTYAPAPGDTHIAFYVRGEAAKKMFDQLGPDKKSVCGTEPGGRVREKEHVACRYRPSDGYRCDFGFDLTSGKSIGGSIC